MISILLCFTPHLPSEQHLSPPNTHRLSATRLQLTNSCFQFGLFISKSKGSLQEVQLIRIVQYQREKLNLHNPHFQFKVHCSETNRAEHFSMKFEKVVQTKAGLWTLMVVHSLSFFFLFLFSFTFAWFLCDYCFAVVKKA